jgi:hypothetical protein
MLRLSLLCLLACLGCASVSAQSGTVAPFSAQPDSIKRAVLLGEPRSSSSIADSPFGIMTTICAEGGPDEYKNRAASSLAAAGYKWVSEYVQLTWREQLAPQLTEAASWSKLQPRCGEYLARLQAAGIQVLMRVDPLPTRMLRGSEPAAEADLALATAYTRSVVAQLGPYVKHWQIGNEPNTHNAPEAYVKVAAAVSQAIRAEQPDAVIYGPAVAMLQCLSEQPYPWLANAVRAGLLQHIDVFSFHPYRANGDEPERASEWARFRHWPTYANQLDALRTLLQAHGHKAPKLAVSEDGESSAISAEGEQRITPVVDAKNELRRALLDFSQAIYPRIHFAFFRNIPDAAYSHEGSFNVVDSQLAKKPLYYAAQNLHAVLDSSYAKAARKAELRGHAKVVVQSYEKHHDGFDELLIFFWSPVPAQNVHLRLPAALDVAGSGWQAPVLIDLMTMPGNAKSVGHEPSTHQRTTYPKAHKTAEGVMVEGLQLRDYPQLLKLIRPK